MSIDTLLRGELVTVTPLELRELLDKPEQHALTTHQHSVRATIEHAAVRYYDKKDALRLSQRPFPDFVAALGDEAVRSATVSFELLHDDLSRLSDTRDNSKWHVKEPKLHHVSDRIRFFVAKTSLGHIDLGPSMGAKLVERRTYAGISTSETGPARVIDIKASIGADRRHERDPRDVFVAPTSVSYYAVKD